MRVRSREANGLKGKKREYCFSILCGLMTEKDS